MIWCTWSTSILSFCLVTNEKHLLLCKTCPTRMTRMMEQEMDVVQCRQSVVMMTCRQASMLSVWLVTNKKHPLLCYASSTQQGWYKQEDDDAGDIVAFSMCRSMCCCARHQCCCNVVNLSITERGTFYLLLLCYFISANAIKPLLNNKVDQGMHNLVGPES